MIVNDMRAMKINDSNVLFVVLFANVKSNIPCKLIKLTKGQTALSNEWSTNIDEKTIELPKK